MTMLFIAHDLSMVKHISDKIGVMYLGNMVEMSSAADLYKNPYHPYTEALLSAVPIADPDVAKTKREFSFKEMFQVRSIRQKDAVFVDVAAKVWTFAMKHARN